LAERLPISSGLSNTSIITSATPGCVADVISTDARALEFWPPHGCHKLSFARGAQVSRPRRGHARVRSKRARMERVRLERTKERKSNAKARGAQRRPRRDEPRMEAYFLASTLAMLSKTCETKHSAH
jgi:hypothetical protein